MAQRRVSRRRTALLLAVIGLIIAAGVACAGGRPTDRATTGANLDGGVAPETNGERDLRSATNAFSARRSDQQSTSSGSDAGGSLAYTAPTPTTAPHFDATKFAGTWTAARDEESWLEVEWLDDDLNWVVARSEDLTVEMEVVADQTYPELTWAGGSVSAELTTLETDDRQGGRQVSDARGMGDRPLADIWLAGYLDTDTGLVDLSFEQVPLRIYGRFWTAEVNASLGFGYDGLTMHGTASFGELVEDDGDNCSYTSFTLPPLTLPPLTPETCIQTEGLFSFLIHLRRA